MGGSVGHLGAGDSHHGGGIFEQHAIHAVRVGGRMEGLACEIGEVLELFRHGLEHGPERETQIDQSAGTGLPPSSRSPHSSGVGAAVAGDHANIAVHRAIPVVDGGQPFELSPLRPSAIGTAFSSPDDGPSVRPSPGGGVEIVLAEAEL